MRTVIQNLPRSYCEDGEVIILFHINEAGHTSSDVYTYVPDVKAWRFLRPASLTDRRAADIAEGWLPGVVAVRNTTEAFSWLSTKKVCQKWSAYYASLPGELGANAT